MALAIAHISLLFPIFLKFSPLSLCRLSLAAFCDAAQAKTHQTRHSAAESAPRLSSSLSPLLSQETRAKLQPLCAFNPHFCYYYLP